MPLVETPKVLSAAEYRRLLRLPPAGADRERPARPRAATELDLQIEVADWFDQVSGPFYAFHVPNGERRDPLVAARLQRMGVKPGVADWCVMIDAGRVLWIELKVDAGRPSKDQLGFQRRCLDLGHSWVVCRSVAEVYATLELAGIEVREPLLARALRESAK